MLSNSWQQSLSHPLATGLSCFVITSCARPLWQCYDSPWQYARILGRSMMPFRQSSGSVMRLQVKARIGGIIH